MSNSSFSDTNLRLSKIYSTIPFLALGSSAALGGYPGGAAFLILSI
jgi:hypothetical protein